MKILVITFSKGINPGTFMQALGVKTGLTIAFPNAKIEFLNFPDFKVHKNIQLPKVSFKTLFLQKMYASLRLLKYIKAYNKSFTLTGQQFDLFNYDITSIKVEFEKYDLIVVGSDTILEKAIDNKNVIGLNWIPVEIQTKKIFFAASASPARIELDENSRIKLKNIVNDFSFVGLRDDLTISFFRDKLNIDATIINKQPDPTYFLDVNSFKLKESLVNKIKNKKIILYNFNAFFPFRKELAFGLKDLGYTLISTFYNPYVDIHLATLDALEWAAVFQYCEVIVTERFHDSLFGLRNCKPVIAIDWDKERFSENGDSKTFGILSDYNMKDFHYNISSINDIEKLLKEFEKTIVNFDKDEIAIKNNTYISNALQYLKRIE